MLRREVLSLATALVSLLPGLAIAQDNTTPPPAPPPAAEPAAPVSAPPAAADQGKNEKTEEITVTGTRIRRKDLTTPAPVTVISREQIQSSGSVSIGQYLQSMPEQGGALNAQFNNGGDGSTQISLRNLGSNRTLVLVNGHRITGFYQAGAGAGVLAVDLNSIPTAAVERVEVLKDGASAVYGSDAIAGVVNVILRKGYSGATAQAYTGTSARGDGTTYDLNVTAGSTGDRSGLLFSAGYFNQSQVWAGDRTFSNKIYALDYSTGKLTFGGSSAIPSGRFSFPVNRDPNTGDILSCKPQTATAPTAEQIAAYNALCSQTLASGSANYVTDSPTTFHRYVGNNDAYNFNPLNYIYTPQQRISLYTNGFAKIGDDLARGYFDASYVNRQSNQKLAPEPIFTTDHAVVVSKDSLYNPIGADITDARRRLVEFGQRTFTQDYNTFRLVGGLDGSLPDTGMPFLRGWSWDVSSNYSRMFGSYTNDGYIRVPRIADALGPSMADPATGTPICVRQAGNAATKIDGCTPVNILGGPGSITPAQVASWGFTGTDRIDWSLGGAQATLSGELFPLFADRPVALAVGYEFRREWGGFTPNPISAAGEQSEGNAIATHGSFHVNEGFAELSIPLVSGMELVNNLEASAAARVSNYSTFGTNATYKFGARYSPVRDVTLRGTFSTGFRAPSILELYQGRADNFPPVSDPCSGLDADGNPKPLSPTLAAKCGAAAANGDDRSQILTHNGGNTDLKPEKANIFTAGVVVEPRYVPNLSFTFDYYNIDVTKAIGTLGATVILDSCYNEVNQQYCNLIHRGADGKIQSIDDFFTNITGQHVSGLDAAARYTMPTAGFGRFTFGLDGSYLLFFNQTLPDADKTVIKLAGTYDLPLQYGGLPKFKANASVAWGLGGFGAGVTTHYVTGFSECSTADGTSGTDGACYTGNGISRRINYWNSSDLFVSYALRRAAGRTAVTAGVTNVFDTRPPHIYNNTTYPSEPSLYDFMGRFFYVRLEHAL